MADSWEQQRVARSAVKKVGKWGVKLVEWRVDKKGEKMVVKLVEP
jgi:hypothetical protein